MPLFLLRYMSAKFEVVGLAIVEAKDSILARRKAEVDEIHQPGLPARFIESGFVVPDPLQQTSRACLIRAFFAQLRRLDPTFKGAICVSGHSPE
jgi:hypothetical protein